jgi:hypothetical protein
MFTKLFSSITTSTIWREDDHTRLVWITMLAMADKNGLVIASVPGLADIARVPLEQTIKALGKLSTPDPWSSSKEYDGRRIEAVDRGWRLLNYGKFRSIRGQDERREYMRNYMEERRKRQDVNSDVNDVNSGKQRKPKLAQAEAEAEAEKLIITPPTPQNAKSRVVDSSLRNATQALFIRLGLAGVPNRIKCEDAIKAYMHAHNCGARQAADGILESWKVYEKQDPGHRFKSTKVGFLEKGLWAVPAKEQKAAATMTALDAHHKAIAESIEELSRK